MKLNFIWKGKTGLYQWGEVLFVNKIRLASCDWNSARSQSDTNQDTKWVGYIRLPLLPDKSQRMYGSTPEEIKGRIEQVVTNWVNELIKEKK